MKHPEPSPPPLGLVTLLLVAVFFLSLQPVTSCDIWWHLATGRLIAQTGAVPSVDPFSFTRPGAPWTPHSWLPDLVAYGLVRMGGLRALVLGLALAGVTVTALAYLLLVRVARGSHGAALVCLLLTVLPTRIAWTLRPNMLSVALALAYMLWLEGPARRSSTTTLRAAGGAAAIAALWANLHAGAVLALVLAAAWVALPPRDEGADAPTRAPGLGGLLRQALGRRRRWLVILGASALALLATPNGRQLYREALEVQPVSAQVIREWASPDFHLFWPLTWAVPGTVAALALTPERPPLRHLLLYAFWLKMFLFSVRHIVFFGLATGLVLVRPVAWALGRLPAPVGPLHRAFRGIVGATSARGLALAVLLLALGSAAALTTGTRLPMEPPAAPATGFPSAAVVAAYRGLPGTARVFNTYAWGGFLLWEAPERPVYIDGRTLPFGRELLDEHAALSEARPGWRATAAARGITHFLVARETVLARVLVELGYRVLAEDAEGLLVENTPPRQP